MKKIFNKVLIAFAAGSISLSSCTNLDETLYDRLNETNIDLSNLVAGIYFYSIEVNGQAVSTKKLIVK